MLATARAVGGGGDGGGEAGEEELGVSGRCEGGAGVAVLRATVACWLHGGAALPGLASA